MAKPGTVTIKIPRGFYWDPEWPYVVACGWYYPDGSAILTIRRATRRERLVRWMLRPLEPLFQWTAQWLARKALGEQE